MESKSRNSLCLFFLMLLLVVAINASPAKGALLDGIGIMGDSITDDYQGLEPYEWTKPNVLTRNYIDGTPAYSWVELLAMYRGLNFGGWGPRIGLNNRSWYGYTFNWAHSAATARNDNIFSFLPPPLSEAENLSAQVLEGRVTLVFLGIGSNDFSPFPSSPFPSTDIGGRYEDIYNGALVGANLNTFQQQIVDNITLALDFIPNPTFAIRGVRELEVLINQ